MKLISTNAVDAYSIVETAYVGRHGEYTLRALEGDIKKVAATKQDEDTSNKCKGDLFEIFANFFFAAMQLDTKIGLTDYGPIDVSGDFGVDGIGVNAAGNKAVAQVKFRSNPADLITYGDVAKTFTAGKKLYGISVENNDAVYIFTNSKGVTPACEKVLGGSLRVIHRGIIKPYVDNNVTFWKYFYECVYSYLDTHTLVVVED